MAASVPGRFQRRPSGAAGATAGAVASCLGRRASTIWAAPCSCWSWATSSASGPGQHRRDSACTVTEHRQQLGKQLVGPLAAPAFACAVAHPFADTVGYARCAGHQQPVRGLGLRRGGQGLDQRQSVGSVIHVDDDGVQSKSLSNWVCGVGQAGGQSRPCTGLSRIGAGGQTGQPGANLNFQEIKLRGHPPWEQDGAKRCTCPVPAPAGLRTRWHRT